MRNIDLKPRNIEAEESVLGSLLIDPGAIVHVSTILTVSDFYIERHGWIYKAILNLYEESQPADLITLSDLLRRRKQLDEIGGEAYLTSLMNVTPTSIHAEHYAKIVSRTATLRKLIDASGQIAKIAHQDTENLEDVIDQVEEIIFAASTKRNVSGLSPIQAGVGRYYDKIEYIRENPNVLAGIPTGLTDLDKMLGGLHGGESIVIAGRPGMGKSSLALNIGHYNAKRWGKNVGLFSLEMPEQQLIQKLVAAESGIDSQRLKLGDIKQDEWPKFFEAIKRCRELPILIDDTPAISCLELRSKARRAHAEHGLDILIVDYLQLMRGDTKSQNRQEEISYISRSIKSLAKELNIPILALSQLNREVDSRQDRKPRLSDLRESGSIEQDADVVLFIYRDAAYDPDTEFPNLADIFVSKQRSGPTGALSVHYDGSTNQFKNLEVRKYSLDEDYRPEPQPSNGLHPINTNGYTRKEPTNGPSPHYTNEL